MSGLFFPSKKKKKKPERKLEREIGRLYQVKITKGHTHARTHILYIDEKRAELSLALVWPSRSRLRAFQNQTLPYPQTLGQERIKIILLLRALAGQASPLV